MQFKSLVTISVLTAAAVAQDFSQVPQCARAPALQAFGKTGCALTDIKCLCSSTSLVPALEAAIEAACTPAEVAQVNQFAVSTCKTAGVTLVIPSASGVTSTASSTTSVSGSTSSSSTSQSTTTTSTRTNTISSSSMSTMSSTSSASAASAVSGSTSTTGSATTSPSPSSTGAGNVLQVGGPALAGAILFALAF